MSLNQIRHLLLYCLIQGLLACNGTDELRSKYIEEGKLFYKAGDYKKAQLAFKKAVETDPQNLPSRYQIAEEFSKQGDIDSALGQYQFVAVQDAKHIMARIRIGQLFLLASKIDEAEKMANEALAIDAQSTEAQVLMGEIYAAQNNSDAAYVKAEAALKNKADDVPAILLLASLHAKTGKIAKAIGLLEQQVEKQVNNVPLRIMLANLYLHKREEAKAEKTLEAIIKMEAGHLEHRQRLAVFYIKNKQPDKAESVLRDATIAMPDSEEAKLALVEFQAAQRSPEVAMAEIIPMLDQDSENYRLRFKLADLQLQLNQVEKVEETLKEIIDLDKSGAQSIKARSKLARLYLSTQRVDEAKVLVSGLLAADKNDLDALALHGEIALSGHNIAEAIADFRTVLAAQPKNIRLLKLLGAAHLVNKDKVLARENIEKVLQFTPEDEAARLDFVNLLMQAGDTQEANNQLKTLFKLNPDSKKGLEIVFKIHLAQKQWEKAQQVAKQLTRAYPSDAGGDYLSGLAYQAEHKLEKSAAQFLLAAEKQPEAIEPLNQLVKTYLALKQADRALSKLNEIVKKQPGNFWAYGLLGDVYSLGNNLNQAYNSYKKAKEINPAWPVAYRNLALINVLKKHRPEAISVLKEGISKVKDPSELIDDLAMIYHQDGESQKVIALYEQLYQQNPHSLSALNKLAAAMANYAKNDEQLIQAEKKAEPLLKSGNPYLLDTVGWIAYKRGKYEKAQEVLSKVIELQGDTAVINYHLGMVYFKLGKKDLARKYLQDALDKNEAFNGVVEAKEVLKSIKDAA